MDLIFFSCRFCDSIWSFVLSQPLAARNDSICRGPSAQQTNDDDDDDDDGIDSDCDDVMVVVMI